MPDMKGMVVNKTTGTLSKGLPNLGSQAKKGPAAEEDTAPMTLKFHAYFVENSFVHKMMINYYLSDDTMEITEGQRGKATKFVKRHRFPKGEGEGSFFEVADLAIDTRVTIYGREFHIVDAPPSTRAYVEKALGVVMPDAVPLPPDMYDGGLPSSTTGLANVSVMTGDSHGKQQSHMSKFLEASLGNTVNNKGLRSFLENDRHVLRFSGVWDNTKSFGGDRQVYTINYYVADDTIEVLEQKAPNDGKSVSPCLLKRSMVPKSPETFTLGVPGRDDEVDVALFYSWRDLSIGMNLNIWGRMVKLTGADYRTREHYSEQGQELAPDLDDAPAPQVGVPEMSSPKRLEIPGISSPSAKAPKTRADQPTMSLTFSARLDTTRSDAKQRRFVFSIFLKDGSVQVREPPLRNSGVMGGMWLSKRRIPKYKEPGAEEKAAAMGRSSIYFTPADFFVGAKIFFNSTKFIIIDVDEHSLKYMENNPGFPLSDYDECLQFMRGVYDAHDTNPELLADLLGDGTKSPDEAVAALCSIGMESDEAKRKTMDTLCGYWGYNWGLESETFMLSGQGDDPVIPEHIARTLVRKVGVGAVASAIAATSIVDGKWPGAAE